MIRTRKLQALLAGAALAGTILSAAADEKAFALCAGCHGFHGEGNQGVGAPAIGGREAWYVARQLEHYRAGVRGGEADPAGQPMATMVRTLTDDAAVAAMADHVAGLPTADPDATVEADVASGQMAYATCSACHGQQGEGNATLNAPGLTGLDDWYLISQLRAFRDGRRGANPDDSYGQQMAPMAAALSDEQIRDIAAFVNTLER